MARVGLNKNLIVERAAVLANERGLDNITLKVIADEFGVQTPSLYNHINSLDDLKKSLMLYGWKQLEAKLLLAVVGVSGYEALRAMCYAFYEYATGNPGVFNAMLCTINFMTRKHKMLQNNYLVFCSRLWEH